MALYQPSHMVPRNQAIDATSENDMKFSWQLNGNNLLCGYNIQIYNADTNKLVYELASTEYERVLQAEIDKYTGYYNNQINKLNQVQDNENVYNESNLKTEFRANIKKIFNTQYNNLTRMQNILNKKKDGQTLSQTEIGNYFSSWNAILNALNNSIGDKEVPIKGSARYIIKELKNLYDIDPKRTDGIQYEDKSKIPVDEKKLDLVIDEAVKLKNYYDEVMDARVSATDVDFISDDTFNSAKSALYLLFSEFSNEIYFSRDLYSAVDSIWREINFDKLEKEINKIAVKIQDEILQLGYALAHYNGGTVTQNINAYKTPNESDLNIAFFIPQNGEVAVLNEETPSGWKKILYKGDTGYIKSTYIKEYNIQQNKYMLLKPISPTNFEGKQNIVTHQLPTNIIENGKAYKWSVTLYWSTSGKYNQDDLIDGSLTSIEAYFDTRKTPIAWLKNEKELFSIPNNNATLVKDVIITYQDEQGTSIQTTMKTGEKVLVLKLVDNNQVAIRYTLPNKKTTDQIVNIDALSGIGNYSPQPHDILTIKIETTIDLQVNQQIQSTVLHVGDKVEFLNYVENSNTERMIIKYKNGIANISSNITNQYPETKKARYELRSKKATFIGGYEQEQFVSIAYFRWVLYELQYDTEEIVGIIKDTGMIPSIDVKMEYDGFLNDRKYAIKLYIQTLDNVEVESELIKFKTSYINITIENMVNAENSPIEHGIIVEWSNLRLITGEIEGGHKYEKDLPTSGKNALTLDKDAVLVFDKDKGLPMKVNWDANQIISTRFDEERPIEPQVYYTASGLDDNGEVISKTLQMIPTETTQENGEVILRYTISTAKGKQYYDKKIIASQLYWYIIIMKKDGFEVYHKFAKGLFPALDQYPNLNKWTKEKRLYPDDLVYREQKSEQVEYNYQKIVDRDGNPK